MNRKTASNELKNARGARAAWTSLLLLLLLLPALTWSGCGEMSLQEYGNTVWEIQQKTASELNSLFAQLQQQGQVSDFKTEALEGLEAAQAMQGIFQEAYDEAGKLNPPGDVKDLHAELLDFYSRGIDLGADYTEAYDHFYTISTVIDDFSTRKLEVLNVIAQSSSDQVLLSAMDKDTQSLQGYMDQLQAEAVPGDTNAFNEYYLGLFRGIKDILTRERNAVVSGDASVRTRLKAELIELFSSLTQSGEGGTPEFSDLADRLLLLMDRSQELRSEINSL